jgi:type III secretory pathway lipoprotein EscJ
MRAHHHDHRPPRGGISPTQAIALGLVAAAVGWAAWLVHERPAAEEVELLPGSVLPSSELAIVEAAFDRAQLTDHRCEEGRIWVPRPRQSAYMRALVDAEALPREFGSSLRRAIETNSPWQSRAAQEEHMRVAVQEELAHVICSMPGIERAAVLYDVAERGGLDGGLASGPVRTASVNVRTLPDVELEPTRVQAIRVLVAASIAGLDAERVAVTDLRSGRVHAGPLAIPADETEGVVDRDLARRVAHEKHLTAKVRQALGFVKGATVDVSVTFPSVAAATAPAAAPRPEPPHRRQKPAAANAPAEVGGEAGDEFAAVDEEATAATAAAATAVREALGTTPDGPETIVVSIAVPESYFGAAVRSARDRDPGADPAAVEAHERQRLVEHVLTLLPATPRPDDRRVALTVFPDLRVREPRVAAGSVGPAPPRAEPSRAMRAVMETATAAWDAAARGDFAAVPREAWLVTGAGVGLLLVLLLARRPPADLDVREARPRRRQPRGDWSEVDRGPRADDDRVDTAPRVAA